MTAWRAAPRQLALFAAIVLGLTACNGPASPSPTGDASTGIGGSVTAGPVCPVQKNPPDPSCAPRLVAGATIVIRDPSGAQVAVAISGADGSFFVRLPPGDYLVDPRPVEGLLGTAAQQPASVANGAVTTIQLDYDTGIR